MPRKFCKNNLGISVMYDAVLFIVMVSISAVVLLPALHSTIALDSSVETHREHIADDALNTYLVSRVNTFSYKVGGDIIDDIAGSIGIDNSSDGLYASITNWLLAREQRHKTYAALLAENLGCQFRLPISIFGTNRCNIFTGDYDRQFQNETKKFFTKYLGGKYHFNLSAWWHPIKGVDFGGKFSIGHKPPNTNCHVSHSIIMMPYSPVLDIGDIHIEFTRHWINTTLFGNILGNISTLENISEILFDFINEIPPYDSIENTSIPLKENISILIDDFLIFGIKNENNVTIFPGIVNATFTYVFDKMKTSITNFTQNTVNDFMGDAFGIADNVFAGLSTTASNPIAEGFSEKINESIQNILQTTVGSIFEAFNALEISIKENVTHIIHSFIHPYIDMLVDYIFEYIERDVLYPTLDIINNIKGYLSFWMAERISINRADVYLTIWEARG